LSFVVVAGLADLAFAVKLEYSLRHRNDWRCRRYWNNRRCRRYWNNWRCRRYWNNWRDCDDWLAENFSI
jgi:hypothetical protein